MNQIQEFYPGIGQAVAERTILRKTNEKWETWEDVAKRVALGNSLLCKTKQEQQEEYEILKNHISQANIIMSGRHLQHGDESQVKRNIECFSNCSSSCTSFSLFYLLMNGSGVGRCYDDDMMLVNWDNAPTICCVLDESHPDFDYSAHETIREAKHKYGSSKDVLWHTVEDTREGLAKALEIWENAAYEKIHKDKILILDFSEIRRKGTPIKGMQNRPASGPVPLMNAFNKAMTIKNSGLPRWVQAMYVDHYFAECVLVGGARRAARMSTKTWRDKSVLGFIEIKRPIEFKGKKPKDILRIKKELNPNTFLWSSNNSVTVDNEFWELLDLKKGSKKYNSPLAKHARKVFAKITFCSYYDGTGEPGLINEDKLDHNKSGIETITASSFISGGKYEIREESKLYLSRLLKSALNKKNYMITNPCGEISLSVYGGYCVIGDVVPYFANSLNEAESAFRATARALIRTNLMQSMYDAEVKRTNRIGVGITGIHEFAFKFFGYGFRDLINEEKSKDFWMTMSRFKRAIDQECIEYCTKYGLNIPHTNTTIKPAGTNSKLFGLTEGWHLLAMRWYLRWVAFSENDPLVEKYTAFGYPTRKLNTYKNTIIVGFPTEPLICSLGLEDKLVTAGEATPEEQYKWIMLGEKYWIHGVDENGNKLKTNTGNQISYTLKYDPKNVSFKTFRNMVKSYQPKVKCCSVMPLEDKSSYEYLPEEPISKELFIEITNKISNKMNEEVTLQHVDCGTGACPIDFKEKIVT